MLFGAGLIIVGAIFLLKNLGIISGVAWGVVWPVVLIVAGLAIFFRKKI
ncbi:MAG: DUF5668 domain-containing protein [Patescibacteria group bacterium]|jgi:hypothetical protein